MDTKSREKAQVVKASAAGLPLKARIFLSIANAVAAATLRRNGTVNRRLCRLMELKSPSRPTRPIKGVTSSDITIDASRKLWFRLYVPAATASSASLPVIFFFHGGGFIQLSPNFFSYDAFCRRYARMLQAVVISVNYRLAPEHKYPAPYDDGMDVLDYLDNEENAARILPENADLGCCFVAGDSAGANVAHHVAKRVCESGLRKLKVIGVIALQPFFGGEERTESEKSLSGIGGLITTRRTDWAWKAFLPPHGGMDRDHEAINVSGPRAADISMLDFPAVLVVVGGLDPLQDWQRRYYEWLKRSGKEAYLVEYPRMIHGFYTFPQIHESKQLVSEVNSFVTKQLAKAVVTA